MRGCIVFLKRHSRLVVFCLFILAFGLRVGWIGLNNGYFPAGDTPTYVGIAGNIVQGNGYVRENGESTAFVVPLYPVFLATLFRVAGENLLLVEVIQALLGALTAVCVYFLSRHIFDFTAGILAGLATCFHPWLIQWTGYILTETVFVFLVILSVLAFVRLLARQRGIQAMWTGFILGLTSLARPVGLFLGLLLFVPWRALFTRTAKYRILLAISLLSLALIYSPWVIRNYMVFHKFIPVSTNSSPLYAANNLTVETHLGKATGQEQTGERYQLPEGIETLGGEVERGEALRNAALQFVWHHPLEFTRRALSRLYLFWSPTFPTYSFKHNLVNTFFYLILYAAAFVGFFLLVRKKQWTHVWIFIIIFACFSFIHAVTIVDWDQRYRLPLQPFLCVLAAAGGLHLLRVLYQFCLGNRLRFGRGISGE